MLILTLEQYTLEKKSKYTNIDISDYDIYYQVPFELGEKGICIMGEDKYVLCFSNNYVYDYIKDDEIKQNIDKNLDHIDITKDWTNIKDDKEDYYYNAYSNKEKHLYRIVKLVQEMKKGVLIRPVIMYFDERAYTCDIKNYIEDGNHRIRALQYLGYRFYPAYIGGNFSEYLIKYLKENYDKKI